MKSFIKVLAGCGVLLACVISNRASAQQMKRPISPEQKYYTPTTKTDTSYTIKVYSGPNHSYGYDIWQGNKPVHHEYVMFYVTLKGKRIFATEEQVKKGSQIAIAKLKKGEAAALTPANIKEAMSISE